jgi:hypothetical protein
MEEPEKVVPGGDLDGREANKASAAATPDKIVQPTASGLAGQINAITALQQSVDKVPGEDWPSALLEVAREVPGAKVIRTASTDGSGSLLSRRPGFLKSTPFGGSQAIV